MEIESVSVKTEVIEDTTWNEVKCSEELEVDYDWTEKLIDSIRRKPAIYDNKLPPQYSGRNITATLWNQVYKEMIPTWHNLSIHERTVKKKELQGKWRNLRTCFRREWTKQRQSKGQTSKKRRKYLYFDKLLFLLPSMEDRPTVNEIDEHSELEEDIEIVDQGEDDNIDKSEGGTRTSTPTTTSATVNNRKMPKEKADEPIDEDKYFLLSLVPALRKLNDAQKLDVKIEFLSTLKRIKLQAH